MDTNFHQSQELKWLRSLLRRHFKNFSIFVVKCLNFGFGLMSVSCPTSKSKDLVLTNQHGRNRVTVLEEYENLNLDYRL